MEINEIIEHLNNAKELDEFICPFVDSGKSLVAHATDELNRIEELEKIIIKFSVRIAELENALTLQRNRTENAFNAGIRFITKKTKQHKEE